MSRIGCKGGGGGAHCWQHVRIYAVELPVNSTHLADIGVELNHSVTELLNVLHTQREREREREREASTHSANSTKSLVRGGGGRGEGGGGRGEGGGGRGEGGGGGGRGEGRGRRGEGEGEVVLACVRSWSALLILLSRLAIL